QALYRAYFDAYVRARLIEETALEAQAMEVLRKAPELGALAAMNCAQQILAQADTPAGAAWRKRVFELADDLFKSIQMQTSVARYGAISVDRGATLDMVDVPLNNRVWLEARFASLRDETDEAKRLAGLN